VATPWTFARLTRLLRCCLPAGLAAGVIGLAAGCATDSYKNVPLTGNPLTDAPVAIEKGPARDRVLWEYRAGLAALREGNYELAKHYLDDAVTRLSNLYGPDASAKQARGQFSAEAKKTFLGEPYERVMAFYYRGILYWHDGEPDNARACFRTGEIMDSDTAERKYAGDYVLLDYLDGYITSRLGGDGADAIKRALDTAKLWKPPAFTNKANVMVFLDYGRGPEKFATGQYGEELRFRGGHSPARSAQVKVAGALGKAVPYDDILFQATTRGGRVMDHVLANKAVFKTTTSAVGDVAIVSGAILASQRNTQVAGLATLGVGIISKIVSATTTPAADTRTWENLPLYISFVALELPPGPQTLTVEFLDAANAPLPGATKTVHLTVPADSRDTVIYVSDQSKTPQTL